MEALRRRSRRWPARFSARKAPMLWNVHSSGVSLVGSFLYGYIYIYKCISNYIITYIYYYCIWYGFENLGWAQKMNSLTDFNETWWWTRGWNGLFASFPNIFGQVVLSGSWPNCCGGRPSSSAAPLLGGGGIWFGCGQVAKLMQVFGSAWSWFKHV